MGMAPMHMAMEAEVAFDQNTGLPQEVLVRSRSPRARVV